MPWPQWSRLLLFRALSGIALYLSACNLTAPNPSYDWAMPPAVANEVTDAIRATMTAAGCADPGAEWAPSFVSEARRQLRANAALHGDRQPDDDMAILEVAPVVAHFSTILLAGRPMSPAAASSLTW